MASPVTFIKEVRNELGKVVWPTPQGVWRSTVIVIAISVAVGLFIGGLDFIFVTITNFLVGGGNR